MTTKNNNHLQSPDESDRIYWKWLDTNYSKKLDDIKTSVKKIYASCEKTYQQMAGFTPHGPEHLSRVENLIHRLIPGKCAENLSMKERFYLLSGAWVHDIGMLRGLFGDNERHPENISADKIREQHHTRSEKFLINNFPSLDIDEIDANILSIISRYHRRREDINLCPLELFVNNEKIRVRLLSAYLRLADSLDIDQSRTPASDYAICMAYNIPTNSKLHWIKSRLVSGISIKNESNSIIIHFKEPHESDIIEELKDLNITSYDYRILNKNIIELRNLIIEDIEEELNSIKNILIRGKISYYLDINQCVNKMVIDKHVFRELIHLASNLDMITHPSASKLMSMVIETFGRILSTSTIKKDNFERSNLSVKNINSFENRELKHILKKLGDFLDELDEQVLKTRSCHSGLKNLIARLRLSLKEKSLSEIKKCIAEEKVSIEEERRNIRNISKSYFSEYLISNKFRSYKDNGKKENITNIFDENYLFHEQFKIFTSETVNTIDFNINYNDIIDKFKCINVMLYGYSELALKALCGFRDCIIENLITYYLKYGNNNLKFHKIDIEKIASCIFRIFVCEGQPKTITANNDALAYHDGSKYCSSLARKKFVNIIMIPDLVAGHILDNSPLNSKVNIDLVIMGANGLEYNILNDSNQISEYSNCFRHSSGHLAISSIVRNFSINESNSTTNIQNTRLLLVIGKSKCNEIIKNNKPTENNNKESNTKEKIGCTKDYDGFKYWSTNDNENIRTEPFLVRDKSIKQEFYANNISLYNPREDIIPLRMVDDLIIDYKYYINIRTDENTRRIILPNEISEEINTKKDRIKNS